VRLHLVDGTYELYRAHFSGRPEHRDPTGQDAKATVGIVESMLALLHEADEAVTHVAVVFDNPIRSFRNDLYLPYKSDDGVPPELRAQFDAAEDAIRSIGIAVWSMREYEADDGLASGARRFRDEVEQVRILSPDKDLGQCLSGNRVVQVDRRQKKVTNEASFRAERGFGPESMPDFLALTGDSADGFPGLPGFGKKSAGMVIGAYGRLEKIPADSAQWRVKPRGALKLAATLAERRDEALLYRKLAILVDDIALDDSLEDLKFQGVPRARFERWCERLGVQRLMAVPRRWQGSAKS
jgi:5'-3' exonuclease